MQSMNSMLNGGMRKKLKKYEPEEVKHNLYCDVCRHHYDLYIFNNGNYEFKDGCDCLLNAEYEKEQRDKKQKFINNVFSQSHINPSIQDAGIKNYIPQDKTQENALETTKKYIKEFATEELDDDSGRKPRNIIFNGSYGTGKSHLAYAIARNVKEKGYSVAFMHVPKLIDRIKATYNKGAKETTDDLIKLLSEIDLLILDDVGVGKSDHTLEKLYTIIDNRVGKNNIFTTNYNVEQLNQSQDWQRIYSRMVKNSRTVTIVGKNHRGQETW